MLRRLLLAIIAPALLFGCSSTKTIKVAVPPRMDLAGYRTIGLVGFNSNAKGDLSRVSTQKFLQAMQSAQPGTRVVELGSESQVLASVNGKSWTPATLKAVKESNGVDAVFVGRLDVEKKARPDVSVSNLFQQVSLCADVESTLMAKLFETDSGATVWTDSADLTVNVANIGLNSFGEGYLDATDPESTYGRMVSDLTYRVTDDFRTHYVTRRVPKEQVQTASGRE